MPQASPQDIVNPGPEPQDEQPRRLTPAVAHIESKPAASAPRNINIGRNAVEISESQRTQRQKWESERLREPMAAVIGNLLPGESPMHEKLWQTNHSRKQSSDPDSCGLNG